MRKAGVFNNVFGVEIINLDLIGFFMFEIDTEEFRVRFCCTQRTSMNEIDDARAISSLDEKCRQLFRQIVSFAEAIEGISLSVFVARAMLIISCQARYASRLTVLCISSLLCAPSNSFCAGNFRTPLRATTINPARKLDAIQIEFHSKPNSKRN